MATKRVYVVSDGDKERCRLVEAGSQAQAISHVVRGQFKAMVATQGQLIGLISIGVKVEKAGGDDE